MSGMAQYIADELTSGIALRNQGNGEGSADFILSVDDDQIAYVDVEDCTVWLITVKKAKFVVANEGEAE